MTLFFQITCPYWIYYGAPVISPFKNNINYHGRLAALKDAISKKARVFIENAGDPVRFRIAIRMARSTPTRFDGSSGFDVRKEAQGIFTGGLQ